MSFSVVTNLASLNGQAALTNTSFNLQKTLGRLSSGLRINSAADDAAGLAVANRDMLDKDTLAAGIQSADRGSTPNDHPVARPDRSVADSRGRRIG